MGHWRPGDSIPTNCSDGLDVVFDGVVPAAGGEAVPVFRREDRP